MSCLRPSVTVLVTCFLAVGVASGAEIARWSMNEGSGDVASSSIGAPGANADFFGDPQWISHLLPPEAGNTAAIQLEADGSFLQSGTLTGVLADGARSIAAWVRTTSDANLTIMDSGVEAASGRFTFRLNSSGAQGALGALRLEVSGGFATANTPVNDGQWHHVALTFPSAGSVDDVKFYVDGVLDADLATVPFSGVTDTLVATQAGLISIGQRVNGQFSYKGSIDEVRVWDEELPSSAVAALVPAGPLPTIHFEVDRGTGSVTLQNNYGESIDGILGYSIQSAVGALDTTGWTSVADNYDADSGSPTFDNDDVWVELTNTTTPNGQDLSEFVPLGDGGILTTTTPLDLGNAWTPFPLEDLEAELLFTGGDRLPIAVEYVGNGGEPLLFGDLDASGAIDAPDWVIFSDNLLSVFPGMSVPQAYNLGDLDFDGDNDRFDFEIFEALYDDARGMGALQTLIAGSAVPEPSSLLLLSLLFVGGLFTYRSSLVTRMSLAPHCVGVPMKAAGTVTRNLLGVLAVTTLGLVATQSATADVVAYYDFESPSPYADKSLNGRDGTVTDPTNVTTAPGKIGDAVVLTAGVLPKDTNTADEWITVPQASAPDFGTGDVSVSLWFKRANPQGDLGTVGADGGPDGIYDSLAGTTAGVQIFILADGRVNGRFDTADAGFMVMNSPAGGVEANTDAPNTFEWHHIAYTVDRTSVTPSAALYVDGVSVGTVAAGSLDGIIGGNISPTQDFVLGAANNTPADGQLDDVAFFDKALSQQEILDLFNGDSTPLDFLERLKIEVNLGSGDVTMFSNVDEPISLDYYEISSPSNSLNKNNWDSLESQNLMPDFPAGSGDGDGWEEAGGSSDMAVGETYLDGMSVFEAATDPVDLGPMFRTAGTQDLTFLYRDATTGTFKQGVIEYIPGTGGLAGDYNGDGMVEQGDLDLVLLNWGSEETPPGWISDPPTGAIGADELDVVRGNWGGSSSLASAVAVPEPASVALLLVLLGGGLVVRRRFC